ncbi:MAG: error-prone DNA polymerase [Dehalococcoidia bacterium]
MHSRPTLAPADSWEAFEARRDAQEQASAFDTPRSKAPRVPGAPIPLDALDGVPYVELHTHSNYSLLEGASRLSELVDTAVEQGHRALALTDHDGMFGAMEFAHAATESGLRPITGLEITVAELDGMRSHLTLLAETRRGYANLCRLSSIAFGINETAVKGKQERRLDPCVTVEDLCAHTEGVILLTGCRTGRLAQLVEAGRPAAAREVLHAYLDWFGREQVFVELVDNLVFGDRPRNEALVRLATECGVPVVGTGDVHYHARERHRLQDVLVAIHHRKSLDESHRERRPNDEFYLRSPQEQAQRFEAYHPEAARNSVRIARRCTFDLTADLGYRLPSPPMEHGRTPIEELEQVCRRRFGAKYGDRMRFTDDDRANAEARLAEELRLIAKHDLTGFFLVYHQVMQLATEVAAEVRGPSRARSVTELPSGRGRGSSVSSIVCYLIGLSHIDPVKNRLYIRRFLNEEMHSLPDIDLDFPRDIRARLIERVYEVWGKDHAALVATLPAYRFRSAIRDVGKVLNLPPTEIDRLAKLATPYDDLQKLDEELHRFAGTADVADGKAWQDLVLIASQLAGFPRHLSQHVGGMVISSEPLIDYVPCQPAAWPNRYLCHWDKDSIDDARMVKIDFLGLAMLSAVEDSVDLIERHRGHIVDLSRIPFDDEAVYDDICRGDTVGVFQIESRAQIAMLPRTQPRSLDDLAVQVSIVRPGPIVGGAVNPYVRRREQRRSDPNCAIEMPHESVRDVLEETLGVVIFQEQVLQVCEQMAGFSAGEADAFRRAMSRRRSKQAMEAYRLQFTAGATQRGVPHAVAERMFETLLGFAEFGFPKSHGTAFALLAYQSTWLKRYYAPEYTCGLFNSQPMGFYQPHVLTRDAQRHGVQVLRPDVNASDAICTVEQSAVRVGLGYVQHVGGAGARRVEEVRRAEGDYRSLFDFVQRTGLPRRATEALIQIGAFDAFGLNRRELLWQLGLFCAGMQRSTLTALQERQLHMQLPTEQDEVSLHDFNPYQRMAADYALMSLSPDAHPMQFLRMGLGEGVLSSRHLQALPGTERATVAGLVVCRQRPLTARGIVFLLLEDEFGLMNVLVSRELASEHRDVVHLAQFVVAEGTLEVRTGEQRTLVATSLREFLPADALVMPRGKAWG